MYLLDTNVISELRRRERCDENVAAWYTGIPGDALFLSVLTLGEIRKGIEMLRDRDPEQAQVLESWLRSVRQNYEGRLLSVDATVADAWGRLHRIRPVPVADGLLAATAEVHRLTLVTRNIQNFQGLGIGMVNPFAPGTGG